MPLKNYIYQFCHTYHISLETLADHANISRSTLYRMLDKNNNPSLLNLTKLAIAMQVHPQFLVQLEWEKQQLMGHLAQAIIPLDETPLEFAQREKDSSSFVSETIPDGSFVVTNEIFIKTWRLQNTGRTVWKNRFLVCQNYDENNKQNQLIPHCHKIPIPTTHIGEVVDLSVTFTAPIIPAKVISYWKMTDKDGELCFPNSMGIYVEVQVISAKRANI